MSFGLGTGGKLSFNEDHFSIIENALNIGSSTNSVDVFVNDNFALKQNQAGLDDISIDVKTGGVHIGQTSSGVDNIKVEKDLTTINTEFLHNSANPVITDTRRDVVVTAGSTKGKFEYVELIPSTIIKSVDVQTQVNQHNTHGGRYRPSTDPTLGWYKVGEVKFEEEGLWLLMSRFALYTRQQTNGSDLNNRSANCYIRIVATSEDGTKEVIYTSGEIFERKNADTKPDELSGSFVSPTTSAFIFVTEADKGKTYSIELKSAKEMYFTQQTWAGRNYATAILLRKN